MALFLTILFGFILGAFATFVACRRVVRSNYIKRVDFDTAISAIRSHSVNVGDSDDSIRVD